MSHASHTSHAAAEFKCEALALAGFKATCKREALKVISSHLSGAERSKQLSRRHDGARSATRKKDKKSYCT